jgi:ribosomal-protein-alanine N-acetyltransferase
MPPSQVAHHRQRRDHARHADRLAHDASLKTGRRPAPEPQQAKRASAGRLGSVEDRADCVRQCALIFQLWVSLERRCAAGGAGTYDLVVSTRLETARLVIRTFEARDADPWLAMVIDPEVRRFLPAGPVPTMEVARRIIGEREAMERELGHAMWAVEDKTTGAFVGQCGLRPVDEGAGPEIDLAYHYTRASWNKGYATEAAVAVIGHGLGPVGLAAIMAVVVPENIGSWRVMEKAGMRYQGLVDYYGMEGLKKYIAAREWWRSPLAS